MPNDLTGGKKEEYERWQGYANALLLASSVVFAGTAVAFSEDTVALFILSTVSGLFTLAFAVSWFALETSAKIKGRPAYLWLASAAFGFQVGFLLLALAFNFT
jgi:hypothetical protein